MKLIHYSILLFLPLAGLSQTLVINEVSYANKTVLLDEEGDSPDWFELYNAGNDPVNLRNYQVTDDTAKLDPWIFPEHILESGEYLVVFASGKDTVCHSRFHTNFKLGNMKDTLFLLNPDGVLIDVVSPTCVPTDCSLGRQPDASGNLVVVQPTPGITNNQAETVSVEYLQDHLTVSHASGFFDAPVSVALTCQEDDNAIMYTLDGSAPDEESDVYDRALYLDDLTPSANRFANQVENMVEPGNLIFKGNILRAVVYSNGCPASNEISNVYFVNEHIKRRYRVPIVSLITDPENLFDDETGIYTEGDHRNFDQHGEKWERPVHVEIFDTAANQVIEQDAGIRIHGRGSRRSPQKSMRLYAEAEYGKTSFGYPLFKQKPYLDDFRVLLLRTTGGTLGPLFKDELCNYLVQDMNMDYAASETVILFINGEYWGIYNLMERQNSFYIEDNYQLVNPHVDIIAYDREIVVEEGDQDEYNELIAWLKQADPRAEDFYEEADKEIDIAALIDYFIAELYLANTDWPLSNIEMWKTDADNARWRYFFFDSDATMLWLDYDHLTEYNNNIGDYQQFPEFSTIVLKTLLNNERFRKEFMTKFSYHMATTFSTPRVLDIINRFEEKYAPMVPEHIYRWHNPVDYPRWNEHVSWLKTYAMQRPIVMAEQLQRNFGNPFTIYPNPCSGDFQMDFFTPVASVTVKAYSLKGELLQQWEVAQSGDDPVYLHSTLPPGFYLLQVNAESRFYFTKLIIM